MGCAVQQEPASNEKSSALKTEKSLKVPSSQCSLKNDSNSSSTVANNKSSSSSSTSGSSSNSQSLKRAHSALVKILESAPLNSSNLNKINRFNGASAGDSGTSSSSPNQCNQVVVVPKEESKICVLASSSGAGSGPSTDSQSTEDPPTVKMKTTPKIEFCPWKKTTIAKEWISACGQDREQNSSPSSDQIQPQQQVEGVSQCAILNEQPHKQHSGGCRSRESSQSSDHSSLSASPEPASDDSGCSNSCSSHGGSSDCCSDYLINDLCKQFEENLCEDHVRSPHSSI